MPNEQDDGSQNPSSMTEEQVGNIVNAAVTNHLKRFAEKQLPAMFEQALKPVLDKMAAPPPSPQEEQTPVKGKKAKEDPEYQALAQQFEQMKSKLDQAEQARSAAEKKGREDRAYADVRAALDGKVRPELADTLAKVLFHVDRKVDFDEQGNAFFKASKAPYAGADPEDIALPIGAGIEDFLRSEAAKPFLPAPSAGSAAPPMQRRPGAASSPQQSPRKLNTDQDKVAAAREAESRAKQKLGI